MTCMCWQMVWPDTHVSVYWLSNAHPATGRSTHLWVQLQCDGVVVMTVALCNCVVLSASKMLQSSGWMCVIDMVYTDYGPCLHVSRGYDLVRGQVGSEGICYAWQEISLCCGASFLLHAQFFGCPLFCCPPLLLDAAAQCFCTTPCHVAVTALRAAAMLQLAQAQAGDWCNTNGLHQVNDGGCVHQYQAQPVAVRRCIILWSCKQAAS